MTEQTPTAAPAPGEAPPPAAQQPEPPKPTEPSEKTLSQSEVDRIVADRVQRERAKFADYADLKAKAGKLDELAEAQKSDLEKAVESARREGESAALAKANGRLVAAEVRALAAGSRFRDPTDAVRYLDLSQIKVADDGTVDTDAIGKQLTELAKQRSYLLVEEKPTLPTPAQAGIGVQGGSKLELKPGADRLRHYYETSGI